MSITLGTTGYCEVGDVQRLLQVTYSTTTKPTTTQVESFITERFEILNGALDAAGYGTPVATSCTKASRILKAINLKGAGADADAARHTPGATGAVGESPRAKSLLTEFMDALKMLQRGTLSLIDAPKGDAVLRDIGERTPDGEFNLDSDGDETDPIFTRDMKF